MCVRGEFKMCVRINAKNFGWAKDLRRKLLMHMLALSEVIFWLSYFSFKASKRQNILYSSI